MTSDQDARPDAATLDLVALATWLRTNVDGSIARIVGARLIGGGVSNLTFEVTDGDRVWVVRRGPAGAFLPTAHDMSREYRFYRALGPTDVPVPAALAYCDDPSVIGVPFYVMERVDGIVLESVADAERFGVEERARCQDELVDVLARIHAVDFVAAGLGDVARHDGYLERQVRRWADQWARSTSGETAEMDELLRRLRAALPPSSATTIVHGDYRLGNVMYSLDDPGRLAAVFDWEMATLGDPLADLGYTLIYWGSDSISLHPSQAIPDLPGFGDKAGLVESYARRSGRAVDALDFYVVLAHVKLVVIGQGTVARRLRAAGGEAPPPPPPGTRERLSSILELASASSLRALRG